MSAPAAGRHVVSKPARAVNAGRRMQILQPFLLMALLTLAPSTRAHTAPQNPEGARPAAARATTGAEGRPTSGEASRAGAAHHGRAPLRPRVPQHRPGDHVGPHQRYRHPPEAARHVVRRRRVGRRVEDRQRGHDVDADLRRAGRVLDRLHHAGPDQPGHRVGGHGRERERAPCGLRRRRLQEPERRQDVDEHGPQELGAHRPDPRRPAQPAGRVCRRGRAAVVAGRRARPLQVRPTAGRRGRSRSRSRKTRA